MIQTLKKQALLTTMLGAICATPAAAATTVGSDSTTALKTSSAGDITIGEDVTLEVSGSTPITIDSDNSLTLEEDAVVQADGTDGRSGILVEAGSDFSIANDGYILVTEDFVPEDEDANSVPDGAIAQASNRYGIRVLSGSGSIENSGTIGVEGLNSYGVAIETDFTGDIENTGAIYVVGDYSTALKTQSVDGDLLLGGTISAVGEGARAVVVDGDVSGTITIDGTITNEVSYSDDDGSTLTLSRSDLRVWAPTVTITGDVAGGVIVAAPPYDLDDDDDDEDDDGVDDSDEDTGSIVAYGESPALLIGGTSNTVIGTVTGRDGTFSLVVDGDISASANYSAFDAIAVEIGGQGGTVDMSGGIGVSGTIVATTVDSSATALLINSGVYVPSLYNSGTIRAIVSSSGESTVTAIQDLSGTLQTIENTGYIYASGSNEDTTVALDLQANTSGITITQYLNDIDAATKAEEEEDEDYDPSDPTIYTGIIGDVLLGSGDDVFDISSGWVKGDTWFGAGNDTLSISDDAIYIGDVYAGTGTFAMTLSGTSSFTGTLDVSNESATLVLSDDASFSGGIANGSNLAVTVDGGVLEAADGEVLSFDTLDVGADGAIAVVLNGDTQSSSSFDIGTATFAEGSELYVSITSLTDVSGSYTILTADQLNGSPDLDLTQSYTLPLLYTGTLETEDDSLVLEVERKTAEELGLTAAQTAAFEPIIAQASKYSVLEASLLQAEDMDALTGQMDALLPDYAGGVFDFVTRASRLASRHLTDQGTLFAVSPVNGWIEPLYFRGSKDAGETAGFKTKGYGISGGLERDFGFGYLGLSLAYLGGSITNGDLQDISSNTLEVAGHWRMKSGPLYGFARISGIRANLSSDRTFTATVDGDDTSYETSGEWSGWALSAMAGASYDITITSQFSLRPKAVLDYFWLKEDGYEEDGADMIDLAVESRTSKAMALTTTMTASYSLGRKRRDMTPLTVELEGGWRSQLSSQLGKTTAAFEDGDQFTLVPDALKGGWTAEARLLAGGLDYTWQIAAGAEHTQGDVDLSARVALTLAF